MPMVVPTRLLLALALTSFASAQEVRVTAPYHPPDLGSAAFRTDQLLFDVAARKKIASDLASFVTYYDPALDAKLLGVALRLDPNSAAATKANELRKQGRVPDGASQKRPTAAAGASYLLNLGGGLAMKTGTDSLVLAGYFLDMASDLEPQDERAGKLLAAFVAAHGAPNWTPILGKPVSEAPPGAAAGGIDKASATFHGLLVQSILEGKCVGMCDEITATVAKSTPGAVTRCVFAGPDAENRFGKEMRIALDESFRAVRLRNPSIATGYDIELSFGEKFVPKDGPSASAVCALLIHALFHPGELADDAAITGDLSVDGKLRKVGGISAKVRAAGVKGLRAVGVPDENAPDLADGILLDSAQFLWKTQVFTLSTLDDAYALARRDREERITRALASFAQIQAALGSATVLTTRNRDLIPKLQEILKDCPNHASAKLMLQILEGKNPRTLSLIGSMEELYRVVEATRAEPKNANDTEALSRAIANLETLRPMMDPRVLDLCSETIQVFRDARQLASGAGTAQTGESMKASVRHLMDLEHRLASNPEFMELL